MATRLLVCQRGFLDSEEQLPVDAADLSRIGVYDGEGMSEEAIRSKAASLGAAYFAEPHGDGVIYAFKHEPNGRPSEPAFR